MDNEKMNAIPEEETEAEVTQNEEVQELADSAEIPDAEQTEEAEAAEETVEEAPEPDEEISDEQTEETAEETELSEEASEEEAPEEEPSEEKLSDENTEEEEIIEEEIDESELCLACGERRKEDDSDYCSECEATMLSRKTPFLGWVSGLLAVVMSVFALALVMLVSAPSIQVARGDSYAKDNCWYTAYREYSEVSTVVEEINSILGEQSVFVQTGTGVSVRIIDAVANAYSPLDALSVAENLIGDGASEISALKKYNKVREDYLAAYEALMEPIEAMTYGEADAATTYAAFEAARGEGINDIYIDYFLFNAAGYYGDSEEVQLKHLEAADAGAKASGQDFSWLYYQDLADLLFEMGENDRAEEYVDVLIDGDKTKFGAYELKMKIAVSNGEMEKAADVLDEFKKYNEGYDTAYSLEAAYLRINGETAKAKELLTEAFEEYESIPEMHRQMALVLLVEGDYDGAYEEVFVADNNAYYLYAYMGDSSAYTAELNNTLYLCTYLAKTLGSGETENAAYFDDILGSFSEEDLSKEVKAIISGEKTVEEVLTKGACDLA